MMKTVKNSSAVRKARITAVRKACITAVRKAKATLKKRPTTKRKDDLIGKLSNDTLVDVLTRLPIKNLFQCMCVSKVWHSMILEPWFRICYRLHNPYGLLIRVNDICPSFWYSTLREEEAEKKAVYHPDGGFINCLTIRNDYRKYNKHEVTQTINGFFCVFFFDYVSVTVRVCRLILFSVWRGEIMEIPVAGFRRTFRYYFGFEPVNNVYKVLAIPWKGSEGMIDCYILTLNLNLNRNTELWSWKKLPDCMQSYPVFRIHVQLPSSYMQSFCVNGFLFWLYHRSLISFDLKEEKFRSVYPPQLNSYHFVSSWITEFRGRTALFKWDSDVDELVLYTLDDKDGLAWTKHVITCLPSELQRRVRSDVFDDDGWTKYVKYLPKELQTRLMDFHLPIVVPIGNLPTTGELLLTNATSEDPFTTTVYAYDHKNNSFKRLVLGKLPQSVVFRPRIFGGQVAHVICCVEPSFSHVDGYY